MIRRSAVFLSAVALALVVAAPHALADPQDVATHVAQQIISPFCPGVTLHDCPSSSGDAMRREILEMAESGMSSDEIIDALVAERGKEILATPSSPIARILPALLVALGAAVALFLMARWTTRRRTERASGVPVLSSAEHARVQRELDRHRDET
jgi:cytochrome c-type biogenesis protein CcmH/NrfF